MSKFVCQKITTDELFRRYNIRDDQQTSREQ